VLGIIEAVNRTFARFYSKKLKGNPNHPLRGAVRRLGWDDPPMCSADLTYWACDQPSTTYCATCRKNLCNQHAVKIGWETFCLPCGAREEKRVKEMFGIKV
jgi:hypothetical protein